MSKVIFGNVSDKNNPYLESLLWKPVGATQMWKWAAEPIYVYFDDRTGGKFAWSSAEKSAFEKAWSTWEAVAKIDIRVTTDRSIADLIEQKHPTSSFSSANTLGNHQTPATIRSTGEAVGKFNIDASVWSSIGTVGGLGMRVVIHELGHALGIAHPHDTGGGSSRFPGLGVVSDLLDWLRGSASLADNNLNHSLYTMMSYNGNYSFKPNGEIELLRGSSLSVSRTYGYKSDPGAFDIDAIQAIYGVKSANTGNNTYMLTDANGAWKTIWDTGGDDTLIYRGSKKAFIDLRPATLDNSETGGGGLSYVANVYAGFTMASDTRVSSAIIEKATGGKGSDTITGNSAANTLEGGAGNDKLSGEKNGDIAVFSGKCADYDITQNSNGTWRVAHTRGTKADGIDTLKDIE